MNSLLGIHALSKAYGNQVLFEDLSFTICQGDRIGLIGPNGAGKSTLLKILVNLELPDAGYLSRKQNLRIGYVSQSPEFPSLSLETILFQEKTHGNEIERLARARILLGKAQFTDFFQSADTLSGGWKKRLDIAKALMHEPDLLLLDEPTNHLDVEGILWLEKFLKREDFSYVVISHDRYFLENVSNKVIEINRCYPQNLFLSEGGMDTFMERKELFLQAQLRQEKNLRAIVEQEVEWMKKSPKARTTKSRSRIQRAHDLLDEFADVKQRNKVYKVDIDFSASEKESRKLLVSKNLSKSFEGRQLFKSIDLTLSPGSRLGIVGKNGTGKTTLLRVLAGMIPQDTGTLKYADDLKIVYFDQHREQIPPHISLREALSPTSEMVNYRGQSIHVRGWAKKFLFAPDRLELPVKCLSGGEKARILIAKLLLQPADVLFLDEPTNDLDIQTLEVIEENLQEFGGAVVLISHDRCLMDRVCTQILGLGAENEQQFFADYTQWERATLLKSPKKNASPKSPSPAPPVSFSAKKLPYKEQKELNEMESSIMQAEMGIQNLQNQLNDPTIYSNAQQSAELYTHLSKAQYKLETLFERWQYLLNKSEKAS